MSDSQPANLPDLLGAVTGGDRLNLDVVQCALGVRPSSVSAGKPFEAILLLQNASDVNVDVTAVVKLPEQDARGKRNRFIVKRERLVVGLRPAEVGFMTLPLSSSPQTAPGSDYRLVMELGVKRMDNRKPTRVRGSDGGGFFVETELSNEVQEHLWRLQQMVFDVDRVGRSGIGVGFSIKEATLGEVADFSPGWTSLWTMRDHVDENLLVDRVRDKLELVLPRVNRDTLFFPLLEHVQTTFREVGRYHLKAGEAVFVTKALVLALEQGTPDLEMDDVADDERPEWFLRLCRILFDRPDAIKNVPYLFTALIFNDLLRDAMRLSLTMINTVTGEGFDSEVERDDYIGSIMDLLEGGGLDFSRVYLPLVLGGLIANTRVVMPQEVPRETIWLLQQARDERLREKDADSAPVFDLTERLLDRALNQTG